jgi:hypothetical protein
MPLYPPKIDLLKIAWKILRAFKLIKKKEKKEKKKRKRKFFQFQNSSVTIKKKKE